MSAHAVQYFEANPFVFCRLKMNGVLSVQNPVEQAVREGKFRELRDNQVEEVD